MNSNKIDVTAHANIDLSKIKIYISEGVGWNTTVIPIYKDKIISESRYPKNPGIYILTIIYDFTLFYSEAIFYRLHPELEKLKFNFYFEGDRLFCKIDSELVSELNKEIVFSKIDEKWEQFLYEFIEIK